MVAPRKFTASVAADTDGDPIPFELDGVYRKRTEDGTVRTWSESFEAMAKPPASVAGSLRNAVLIDQQGRQGVNPAVTIDFIQQCLVEESATRFAELLQDRDRFVRLELLGDVFTWLSEEVVGKRPLPPALQSLSGETSTAPTSPAG